MIIDTDVSIWYLRGNSRAKEVVEAAIPFSVSAVTYMELVQGMKDKSEFCRYQKAFKSWNIDIIQNDRETSSRAIFYVQEDHLSHSMLMADARIAATAVQEGDTLVIANDKHDRHFPNLDLRKFIVE